MSQRYALVTEAGEVENVVVWDGGDEWSPPAGYEAILVEDAPHVGLGWTRVSGEWVAPPPPEPEEG